MVTLLSNYSLVILNEAELIKKNDSREIAENTVSKPANASLMLVKEVRESMETNLVEENTVLSSYRCKSDGSKGAC